jgi:DNA-binding MarR family transcriptional regulator
VRSSTATAYCIPDLPARGRRAKLIILTKKGEACIAAGIATIDGIEQQLADRLGERGYRQLRSLLTKLLEDDGA